MTRWPGAVALASVIGLIAAPHVAAADATATAPAAAPATLSARAAILVAPGLTTATTGTVSGGAGTDDGGAPVSLPGTTVISGGSWDSNITPGQVQAIVDGGTLFDGDITFSSATATAQIAGDGSVVSETTSLTGLVVLGVSQTLSPGGSVTLGDWGTLATDAIRTAGDPSGADPESAITITLTAAHDGLPAGTQLVVAQVEVTPPAAATPPATPPGDSGSGEPPGSEPPAGAPTGTHTAHVTPPRTGPGVLHRQGRHLGHRSRRPLTTHPKTLPAEAGERIVAWAASQIGWPYVWGGDSEAEGGFDCSGLVDFAYASAGYPLPGRPTAEVLYEMSQPISAAQLRPGDLVFLQTPSGYAYHVALYAGHGEVIVAAHQGAPVARVPLSSVDWDAYGRIWIGGTLGPRAAPAPGAALVSRVVAAASTDGRGGSAGAAAPAIRSVGSVRNRVPAKLPQRRAPHATPVWSDRRAPVVPVAKALRGRLGGQRAAHAGRDEPGRRPSPGRVARPPPRAAGRALKCEGVSQGAYWFRHGRFSGKVASRGSRWPRKIPGKPQVRKMISHSLPN